VEMAKYFLASTGWLRCAVSLGRENRVVTLSLGQIWRLFAPKKLGNAPRAHLHTHYHDTALTSIPREQDEKRVNR
jgi:hypothetical protein